MTDLEKIQKGIGLAVEGFTGAMEQMAIQLNKACRNIVEALNPTLKKKLTKKKFCKLLQSHNIQRNEINKIIHNNKKAYTYGRLLKIIGGTND